MGDFLGDLIGRSLGQATMVRPRRTPFFGPTPHLPGDLGPGVANVLSVNELDLPLQRGEVDATLEPILVERDAPAIPGRTQDRQPASGAGGYTTDRPLDETRNDSFPANRGDMPAPLPPDRPHLPAPQTAAESPMKHAHIQHRSDLPKPDHAVTLRGQAQVPAGAAQFAPRPQPENPNVNPPAVAQTRPSHGGPVDVLTPGVTHRPVAGVQGIPLSGSQQPAAPDLPQASASVSVPHAVKPVPRTDTSPPQPTGRMSSHDNRERQPESTPATPARRASNRARAAAADGSPVTTRDLPSPVDEVSPQRTMPVPARPPQSTGEPPSPRSRAEPPAPTPVTPAGRTSNPARTLVADVSETAGFDRQASIDDPTRRWVTPAVSSVVDGSETARFDRQASIDDPVRRWVTPTVSSFPPPASTSGAATSVTVQPAVTDITMVRPVAQLKSDLTAEASRPAPRSIAKAVSPVPAQPGPIQPALPENRARVRSTPPEPEARVDPPAAPQPTRPVVVRVAPHAEQATPEPSAPVPPTINVTIGRIEVRAIPPPASTVRKQSAAPVMTLDEYMKSRSGGRR